MQSSAKRRMSDASLSRTIAFVFGIVLLYNAVISE